jgi:formylglycine-generating enzyme required for sulfatase activity
MAAGLAAGLVLAALPAEASAPPRGMVRVGPGILRPVYPPSPEETELPVAAFWLDRLPVTNAEFLAFVQAHPRWRRGTLPRLFADESYLAHWAGPIALGPAALPEQPVVRVSWFAAKAYCAARGARLPTETEWEFAAAASPTRADGRDEPGYREQLLSWYSRPTPKVLPRVGQQPANFWGVRDMHGLVWEWVLDFGNALVSADSRESGDPNKMRFCGSGALAAGEKGDYASFMRIAFRGSLQASYTTGNLGFRCAKDAAGGRP